MAMCRWMVRSSPPPARTARALAAPDMHGGIVRVRVEHDTFWVNYQLGELEQALASRGFFRARRSSLVNLKRVKEIRSDPRSSFVLVMRDAKNTEVEVSERQGRVLRTRIPGL